MIAQEQLTDNKDELKDMVYRLIGVVEEQKLLIANQNERIEALCQRNEEQAEKLEQLTCEIVALKRHRFGRRSEKLNEENTITHDSVSEANDNGNEAIDSPTSPDGYFEPIVFVHL
jgi:flagellar motility protein MotE (MotC chaperone)